MNKTEIMAFLKTTPICFLATTEGNKPHVRALGVYRVDENGIILQSGKRKDLHKQLVENPEVEICFCDLENFMQVRVSGRIEIVEDLALKKEIVDKRPHIKPVVERMGYDLISVYRLKNGKATFWSMKEPLAPKTYVDL
jgi:pyridoxamine 5'-phosphate oxidase